MRPGTALDKEAQRRCTTVYLVNMVIPMLPPLLCECLCSLNPSVDRLAFSAIWRMHADGSLVDEDPAGTSGYPWFGRTVIRSCCKLDYATAQRMIEGTISADQSNDAIPGEVWATDRRPTDGHTIKGVVESTLGLARIAAARRTARFAGGALALHKVKLIFHKDPTTGNPVGVGSYPIKDSNRLVEEYMLLANYLVAQQMLQRAGGRALLRRHPSPQARKFGEFLATMARCGIPVDGRTAGTLAASLRELHHVGEDSARAAAAAGAGAPAAAGEMVPDESTPEQQLAAVVELLATGPMCPAQYMAAGHFEADDWRHYALNIPYYTHFTSPIRRYADTLVHRVLADTLMRSEEGGPTGGRTRKGQSACKGFYLSKDEVGEIAEKYVILGSLFASVQSNSLLCQLPVRLFPR